MTSGDHAAEVIRKTLARLERDEEVLWTPDDLASGPLQDVDGDSACRIGWWERLHGRALDDAERLALDDRALWDRIRRATTRVMLWHGPHPADRLLVLRACWHLRDQAERVFEVALPAGATRGLGAFYGAVAVAGPGVATENWDHRRQVIDVAARATQWIELRDCPGDWARALDGDSVVQQPVTMFDPLLLLACTPNAWTGTAYVVGQVLADHPTSPAVLFWRVSELLREGTLEGRGHDARLGIAAKVRPAAARS